MPVSQLHNRPRLERIFSAVAMTIGFTIGWLTPAAADTYIRGEISGYLIPVNSPYYVIGDITVPDTLSLTIESGVHVIFLGDYLFTVYGFVSALGDSQRDGRIYIGNDSSSWRGIRFDQCSTSLEPESA